MNTDDISKDFNVGWSNGQAVEYLGDMRNLSSMIMRLDGRNTRITIERKQDNIRTLAAWATADNMFMHVAIWNNCFVQKLIGEIWFDRKPDRYGMPWLGAPTERD